MNERKTLSYETPSGISFEIKEYLTAREARAIQNASLSSMDVKMEQDATPTGKLGMIPRIGKVNLGQMQDAANDALLEQAIVSLDGSTDDILPRLLDLRRDDFQFILDKANLLLRDPKKPE